MEITPFILYAVMLMDPINDFFAGFSVVFGILSIMVGIFLFISFADSDANKFQPILKKASKWIFSIFVVSTAMNVFTPTTKEVAIIFGVPYMLEKVKDTNMHKIPPKLIELADIYIDKEIMGMRKDLEKAGQK